jgi:formylmethanofuran dehydrogenase subunit C
VTGLTLTLKERPGQWVDASPLTPEGLCFRTLREVAAVELAVGNERVRAGDLFEISGDPLECEGKATVTFHDAGRKLAFIGKGMTYGEIIFHGDAGPYLGLSMRGGAIRVSGEAGPFAASGMSGGAIWINGDAGDHLAAAIPGERNGMRGGVVRVGGNVGHRAGDRMRRGVLLVAGDAGDYCGSRMTAGSIVVLGRVGEFTGLGMKRGSVILLNSPARMLATFNDCGTHTIHFLRLFMDYVRGFGGKFEQLDRSYSRVRRFAGDQGVSGRGEILICQL